MILTIAEDFTSTVVLDSELTSLSDSGMYLNSGVHPSITTSTLLQFLPKVDFTFTAFSAGTTYGKYTDSRKVTDIVTDGGKIFQSLVASNTGNTPASSTTQWLETNIESLRIKSFVLKSQDTAIARIHLTRRLTDSQFLYNVAEVAEEPTSTVLPEDFAAWVFEPRGSDYVTFRLNQVAFQATTATPQSLFVINQGQLVTTLTLNPNAEGRLVFEDLGYVFSGKGKWLFAVESQTVLTNGSVIDPLRNDGFLAYTASGIGATAEDADYSFGVSNNGLNFNVSTFFDGSLYIDNNLLDFGNYIQTAWELDVLNMFLHNAHSRSNRDQRIINSREIEGETKDLQSFTVARKFKEEKKRAIKLLDRTFDREINDNDFEIQVGSM